MTFINYFCFKILNFIYYKSIILNRKIFIRVCKRINIISYINEEYRDIACKKHVFVFNVVLF